MKYRILLVFVTFLFAVAFSTAQTATNTSAEEDMAYMLEEEKLARDIYIELYNKWEHRVFKNISQSEQRHFDKMKELVITNRVEMPNLEGIEKAGVFENEELQKLYHQLVKEGKLSLKKAFLVGAKIEELDIRDLKDAINRTKNSESQQVYESLLKASENHLRAFNRNLEKVGVQYQPVILSQEYFDSVINTDNKGNKFQKRKGKRG